MRSSSPETQLADRESRVKPVGDFSVVVASAVSDFSSVL